MSKKRKNKKSFWMKQMHTWHWISSAICLICMILFAITGITLNHASFFESEPEEKVVETVIPQEVLVSLQLQTERAIEQGSLDNLEFSNGFIAYLEDKIPHDLSLLKEQPDWSEEEIYIQKPLPGGDVWMSVDIPSGELVYMHTERGIIAWLNDLHKGRNTSLVWIWFIDIFAIATLIFCLTGLVLLQLHSKNRPSTWYVTAAGIIVPAILAIFLI
ncbi:PepSY-associated TM helix domain-containing protein [Kangiella spongicola]|uniref:Peptidase n=1 Tax=Kangiella spongicola TaxID=796379 RepID=A0A318D3M6_9GAMM|nr:PepSY-associated TM helix domain-containing protein [Kangiella spongicola]PXF63922.1 hypothetical protein DL796_01915 [Kangiella spongicola]